MQDFESEDWFKPYEEEGGESEEDPDSSDPAPGGEGAGGAAPRKGKRKRRAGKDRGLKRVLPFLPWIFAGILSIFVFTNSARISGGGASPLKESVSYLNGEISAASSLREGLSALGEDFSNLSASPSANFVNNILTACYLKSAMKSDLAKASALESSKLASSISEAKAILKGAPPGNASSSLASLLGRAEASSFSPTLPSLRKEAALSSSLSSLAGAVALKKAMGGRVK